VGERQMLPMQTNKMEIFALSFIDQTQYLYYPAGTTASNARQTRFQLTRKPRKAGRAGW